MNMGNYLESSLFARSMASTLQEEKEKSFHQKKTSQKENKINHKNYGIVTTMNVQ